MKVAIEELLALLETATKLKGQSNVTQVVTPEILQSLIEEVIISRSRPLVGYTLNVTDRHSKPR